MDKPDDVTTVAGDGGLRRYTEEPWLDGSELAWREGPAASLDDTIIATVEKPFMQDGGLRLMHGNLGRAVVKTSAIRDQHRIIKAPAVVFHSQAALKKAFEQDELNHDFIAIIAYQGPRANGMPELHQLTPILGVLLDRGHKVGLVTDGRMSGASGKVPAAIHVSPECLLDGPLGRVQDGDMIEMNTHTGELNALVDNKEWESRSVQTPDLSGNEDIGRRLFQGFRAHVSTAETGAISAFGETG